MGDLAVPVLEPLLQSRDTEVLDDLLAIGTPLAATTLVPSLWDTNNDFAAMSAWRLASLLPKIGVEDAFRDYPLTPQQKKAPFLDWIWAPFAETESSALPIIAGRIAFLLASANVQQAPKQRHVLDPRLVIPLLVIKNLSEAGLPKLKNSIALKEHQGKLREIRKTLEEPGLPVWLAAKHESSKAGAKTKTENININIKTILGLLNPSPRWRLLLNGLPSEARADLLDRLLLLLTSRFAGAENLMPTEADWRTVLRFTHPDSSKTWPHRASRSAPLLIPFLISAHAIFSAATIIATAPKSLSTSVPALTAIAIIVLAWALTLPHIKTFHTAEGLMFVCLLSPLVAIYGLVTDARKKDIDRRTILLVLVMLIWTPAIGYYSTNALLAAYSLRHVVVTWIFLLCSSFVLWRIGSARDRRSRNPLQGIISSKTTVAS
jgi:hypothetical protein